MKRHYIYREKSIAPPKNRVLLFISVMQVGLLCLTAPDLMAFAAGDSTKRSSEARSDSTINEIKSMGLFDLNWSLNSRSARMSPETDAGSYKTNSAFGLSGRMQSSIRWSYLADKPARKFRWGDILGAEVFAGRVNTVLEHQTKNVWVAYQFEFGLGGLLKLNDHSEAGLNLILLKFAKDNVTGNISGSGVTARYRYKRLLVEAGAEARHDRALGVLIDIHQHVPMQFIFTARYLMKSGRNVGVTIENLSGNFHQDNFQYTKIWSLKIFYGIYF